MPCYITVSCIACGDCEPECPRGAISQGSSIYVINQQQCNDCSGYHKSPRCIDICGDKQAIVHSPPQQ